MASWRGEDDEIYLRNEEALRSREREDFWRGAIYGLAPQEEGKEEEDDPPPDWKRRGFLNAHKPDNDEHSFGL